MPYKLPDHLACRTEGCKVCVVSQRYRLTTREVQVIALACAGMTEAEMSRTMGCGMETIGRHIANIYTKMGAGSRLELALWAVHHGIAGSMYEEARA